MTLEIALLAAAKLGVDAAQRGNAVPEYSL
jgi:hypothetical protein